MSIAYWLLGSVIVGCWIIPLIIAGVGEILDAHTYIFFEDKVVHICLGVGLILLVVAIITGFVLLGTLLPWENIVL